MITQYSKEISDIKLSFNEKIDALLKTGIQLNKPVAIWKIGGSNNIIGICQLIDNQYNSINIESLTSGFILTPFYKNNSKIFINADVLISSENNELKSSLSSLESIVYDNFRNCYEKEKTTRQFNYTKSFENKVILQKQKNDYLTLIKKTINAINSGNYQKIVLSRTKKIELEINFNPITEFNKLCDVYPDAFVSLVYIPNEGLWLGTTPELLISIDKKKIFKTVALAGTQKIPDNLQISKIAWTQKDIKEQALVSRYIINCFKKIRLREFEEYGPQTVKAANLIHLKTEFRVNMKMMNFPQLGSVMLNLLHPTSAVCGMPMEESADFLKTNEGYDREYYSGYLGPINIFDETNIFVNLRCMKIMKNYAILFAGGGITKDSDSESEWLETEMKFQTLLNVIQS